jgi:hypothetical protein
MLGAAFLVVPSLRPKRYRAAASAWTAGSAAAHCALRLARDGLAGFLLADAVAKSGSRFSLSAGADEFGFRLFSVASLEPDLRHERVT